MDTTSRHRLVTICFATFALILAQPAFATFANSTGIARVPVQGTADEGFGVALQVDGKTLVAGRCIGSGVANWNPCVARLNTDGTLDTTFNASGPLPGKRVISSLRIDRAVLLRSVKVLVSGDGKILIATTCESSITGAQQFCVARLNADGSSDNTFDGPDTTQPGNGHFIVPITSANDSLYDAAIQRIDDLIVLVGRCGGYHCVARLRASDGGFDTDSDGAGFIGPSAAADRAPADPGQVGRVVFRF
ncbi:MAG: hypothetical protein ABL931_17125, partial [Usitatibacteraceae bacterium]